jgi:DNA-directed RNA polymerase specialized sigma24 family protein
VRRVLREVRDRLDRQRTEHMLQEQERLLKLIASGRPLNECLAAVCTAISHLNPRTRACFLLAEVTGQTFERSIAPDIPPSFGQGLKDAPINDLCRFPQARPG